MKSLKRKDSCTFKREISLDNQERIYLLTRKQSSNKPEQSGRLAPDPAAKNLPRSTGATLLKHLGTWVGDDLEKCLAEVYAARGHAHF